MITELKNQIITVDVKMHPSGLLILALSSILIVFINLKNVTHNPLPERGEMIAAARQVIKALQEIRKFRSEKNIPMPAALDPIESGLIGQEFSSITTTLGDLTAKQVSLNPDFAALFVHWFNILGLSKGDRVVIHASGSFPSLSIAAVIATETAGLEPLIFSSIGSSAFGANLPQLTYWDIENHLYRNGIIGQRTICATPGGENDNGSSFWPGGLEIAEAAALRNNYPLVVPVDLRQAVSMKYKQIKSFDPVRLFINIGGNQAALGSGPCATQIPPGLITERLFNTCDNPGLIHLLSNESIPVIHLLNIRALALQNGISLDPDIKNDPGFTRLYFKMNKPLWLAIFSLIILALLITGVKFFEKKIEGRKRSGTADLS
jgi:poly-gamma-glutamate system protein